MLPTLELRPWRDGLAGIDAVKARSSGGVWVAAPGALTRGCPGLWGGAPRGWEVTGNPFNWTEREALPHPRDGVRLGGPG